MKPRADFAPIVILLLSCLREAFTDTFYDHMEDYEEIPFPGPPQPRNMMEIHQVANTTPSFRINLTFYIIKIGEPDLKKNTFDIHVFLVEDWSIAHPYVCADISFEFQRSGKFPSRKDKFLPTGLPEGIFVPDLYIEEAIEMDAPTVVKPAVSFSHRVDNRTCFGSLHMKFFSKIACPMDLHDFPVDVQRCPLNIHTWVYPNDCLHVKWVYPPNEKLKSMSAMAKPNLCMLEFDVSIEAYAEGDPYFFEDDLKVFDGVRILIRFRRMITYQMIKTYVPSLFLMAVGFSSFWISLDASNERLSLSTTILLALYTQLGAIKNSIPNLSYLTLCDIYVIACMGFVFLSICESVLMEKLNSMAKKDPKASEKLGGRPLRGRTFTNQGFLRTQRGRIEKIEKYNRYARNSIVACFGLFNIAYFSAIAIKIYS